MEALWPNILITPDKYMVNRPDNLLTLVIKPELIGKKKYEDYFIHSLVFKPMCK